MNNEKPNNQKGNKRGEEPVGNLPIGYGTDRPAATYDGLLLQELLALVDEVLRRHEEIERLRAADVDARMDCRQSQF